MFVFSPSIEKMKSLAVWISSARWSSYSRCSCFVNSAISRFRSSILVPDLKSSSGWCGTCLVLVGVAVGLLPAEPARLESAGAAMFARRRWNRSTGAHALYGAGRKETGLNIRCCTHRDYLANCLMCIKIA